MTSQESGNTQLSRRQLLVAGSLAAFSGILAACSSKRPNAHKNNPLDFSQLPEGPIDSTIWSFDLDPLTPTYNEEAQKYTSDHAGIYAHTLVIDAARTADGYDSSRINTQGKFDFTYGTLTARAKLPRGIGTWPALWLLPEEKDTPAVLKKYNLPNNTGDDYYYVYGGEIDWLETVGAEASPVNNQPAVHTYNSRTAGDADMSSGFVPVPDGQDAFHDYGLRKSPGLLEFTLDGKVVHRVARKKGDSLKDWPFDDYRYFVVANLAMGGTWGGERRDEFPPAGIDDSETSWKFEIASLDFQPY